MERLTERKYGEIVSSKRERTQIHCSNFCNNCSQGTGNCDYVREMVEKLAEYEDAEEQGLLFKTPFKIGQPIWFVGNELIGDYVIKQFIVTEEGVEAVKIYKVIDGKEYWNTFYTEQWLVSVFPSKEEAEQKLAEMKGV